MWLLDHEDGFGTRQFVNVSVEQLAECLIAYMGEQQSDRFRSAVEPSTRRRYLDGAFWSHEVVALYAEA